MLLQNLVRPRLDWPDYRRRPCIVMMVISRNSLKKFIVPLIISPSFSGAAEMNKIAGQLEYDTQLSCLSLLGKMFLPSFPRGMERAFCYALRRQLLFDRLYRLQGDCCSCFPKRNFHPDRACFLATGLPVE